MTRTFLAIFSIALVSVSISGCASDLTPEEQDRLSREYRSTLQPGGR